MSDELPNLSGNEFIKFSTSTKKDSTSKFKQNFTAENLEGNTKSILTDPRMTQWMKNAGYDVSPENLERFIQNDMVPNIRKLTQPQINPTTNIRMQQFVGHDINYKVKGDEGGVENSKLRKIEDTRLREAVSSDGKQMQTLENEITGKYYQSYIGNKIQGVSPVEKIQAGRGIDKDGNTTDANSYYVTPDFKEIYKNYNPGEQRQIVRLNDTTSLEMNLNTTLPSNSDLIANSRPGEYVLREDKTVDYTQIQQETFTNTLIPSSNLTILEDRKGNNQFTNVQNEDLEYAARNVNFPLLDSTQNVLGQETHTTDKKFMERRAHGPSRSLKNFTDFQETNLTYYPERNIGEIKLKVGRSIETPDGMIQEFNIQRGERTALSKFNIENLPTVSGLTRKRDDLDTPLLNQQVGDVRKQQLVSNYQIEPKVVKQNTLEAVEYAPETTTKRYNHLRPITEVEAHGKIGVNEQVRPEINVSLKLNRSNRKNAAENKNLKVFVDSINYPTVETFGDETRPSRKVKSENVRVLMI